MTLIPPNSPPAQRRPNVEDKKYRASFNGQECILCGNDYDTVGAHIRADGVFSSDGGGMGYKNDDSLILPLCHRHHMEQESQSGLNWWEDAFKMTIDKVKELARQRYAAWKNPSVSDEEDM